MPEHVMLQRVSQMLVLLCCVAVTSGCLRARLGGKPNADDALRQENLQLKKLVAEMEQKLALRSGELESLRQQLERGPQPMAGAEPPVLAQIAFGRYTAALDSDRSGGDDLIRVYVRTLDQRGRMLPVAGRATLQAVFIEPGRDPGLIAKRDFDPSEWDAAYRSGLSGTHYTLELPLPEDLPDGVAEATVKLSFTQADSGAEFSTQQAVAIER